MNAHTDWRGEHLIRSPRRVKADRYAKRVSDEALREVWDRGLSTREAAAEVGLASNRAVWARWRRMGLDTSGAR